MIFSKPSLDDYKSFIRLDKDTRQVAANIKHALGQLSGCLDLVGALALAQTRNPDQSPLDAMLALQAEVEGLTAYAKRYQGEFKALGDTERERLAPFTSAAVRRTFAIQHRIQGVKSSASSFEQATEKRRNDLLKANVSPEDIDNLTPLFDPAAGAAEIEALQVELTAIELFLSTSDESHLPEGFDASPALKWELPREPVPSWGK